ncbi:hypothetical protein T01_2467 [Trichinella spiralis]|uniref:Uncharacterized protein n=1 Tax=Trichinella spiralis TaxID=6334 RepID=A0A0V1AM98_TRISP|nr:hypothetical protein T01_2467 [Trichinella spiralis]
MDWGITAIDDRTVGTRIGDGLYNTGIWLYGRVEGMPLLRSNKWSGKKVHH